MVTSFKNNAVTRLLLPRFSKRRALVAGLWRSSKAGLAACSMAFMLMRQHGCAGMLQRLRWHWKRTEEDTPGALATAVPPASLLPQLLADAYPQGLPLVSLVVPLYAKQLEVPFFLHTVFQQEYPGLIELVLVDDCCPFQSMQKAQEAFSSLKSQHPNANISLQALQTASNSGNCHARNMGFDAATGDIVMVLDADCLLSASFISLHALYMAAGPYDALLGLCNLETGHQQPLNALKKYEAEPQRVYREWPAQGSLCPTGFVNCITRNFSIRKNRAPLPLFDENFSYSAQKKSGFGWEDVEMGRRLYDAGLRLGYAEGTFTVHISHEQTVPQKDMGMRSLRNFLKLLEKHPDMPDIANQWVHHTYAAIRQLEGGSLRSDTPECVITEKIIGVAGIPKIPSKKIRILTFHWHTSHQYELFKLPHDFFLVTGIGEPFVQRWNKERRPQPDNVRFVPHAQVRWQDYDLAILPFDENVLAPHNCNGVLGSHWGDMFQWFLQQTPLPMIGICHGTPQFFGQYGASCAESELLHVIESERLRLVDAVKDFIVVCNSHQAEKEWEFSRSTVIWHGFDPMEFPLRQQGSTGCLTLGTEALESRPWYNGLFAYQEACTRLPGALAPKGIRTPLPQGNFLKGNLYARAKFRNYVDVLRNHSVYLNPTQRSPMPRTRGEAMLCGLVPVSFPNHDAGMFITNGKNGFVGSCPQELGEYVAFCLKNKNAAWQLGLEARKSACALFSVDRYLAEWQALLHATL